MKRFFFMLIIGVVLTACGSAAQETKITVPEPTIPPIPTLTATELIETELPPHPSATITMEPTLTVLPTDTPPALQINFTPSENNPIVSTGNSGEWDYYRAFGARVVLIEDTFHLFYGGWGEETNGIGYATSSDGFTFTKHNTNPIFQPDGEGFDALAVRLPTPLVVGDSGFVIPNSVIATVDGYRMYYTGGLNLDRFYIQAQGNERSGAMCGMATSADGISWIKYDDPSTTEIPYAESDPVMGPNSSGWDDVDVKCGVMSTDTGWEMVYKGLGTATDGINSKFGYATSTDGVDWVKYPGNPIYQSNKDLLARNNEFVIEPSILKDGSTYYLYYSYAGRAMEGVATGTITQP